MEIHSKVLSFYFIRPTWLGKMGNPESSLNPLNDLLRRRRKRKKKCLKISNSKSLFLIILSVLHQGSILGPLLFNRFLNDSLYLLKKSNLRNHAGDTNKTVFCKDLDHFIQILVEKSENAIAIDCKLTTEVLKYLKHFN